MPHLIFAAALTIAMAVSETPVLQPDASAGNSPLRYPETRQIDQVDVYHGVSVRDPYRWLEDLDGAETRAWIEAQNALAFGYLEQLPQRQNLKTRLTELWDFERYGVPMQRGGRYFFTRNDGLQNQSVLWVSEGLTGTARVLLDPNPLSPDGTVALADWEPSEDGKLVAYALSASGSDWMEWRVREVASGRDLPDLVRWSKFSGASWAKDGGGFYYSRYNEPKPGEEYEQATYFHKLYYHRLGTPQSEDRLVCERPDQKEWGFGGEVSADGSYLVITVWQGTDERTRIFYLDLTAPGAQVVPLLTDFDASYVYLGNQGTTFWFRTNLAAPRGRVVAIDIAQPARDLWRELVPQAEETLQTATVVGGRIVGEYLRDAHSVVRLFALDGKPAGEIALPGLGSVWGLGGRLADRETFYSFTSFTTPTTIYRFDFEVGKSEIFRQPRVAFDPNQFETRQVFATSKDGTRVPIFISAKKGVKLDGSNPTLLYGYGGFNISITPSFSVAALVWMERGGVDAVVNLRGGGEYGEEWHQAGMKLKKQNVFDDFVAAAEWLIANRYTGPEKLAIHGGSNGGLLVGAALTQRPDLFAAAVPAVGVLDMLRFHQYTIGWAWASDYGSANDPEEFKALYAYSPLHNVQAGTRYPATLIVTGDHDDRVVPAHSYKFAAALQAAQAGPAPILLRVDTKAGHGAGKPVAMRIEELADILAFVDQVLQARQPGPAAAGHSTSAPTQQ